MKKVISILIIIVAILAVNAQIPKTTVIKEKPLPSKIMVADLGKTIPDNIAKDYDGYSFPIIYGIADELTKEYGRLNLFALSEREDIKDKWDVLISVSINSEKKNELIDKVITKFRTKLQPSELKQISRFVYLEPDQASVKVFNSLIQCNNSHIEIINNTINNVRIGHAIVISSNHNPN